MTSSLPRKCSTTELGGRCRTAQLRLLLRTTIVTSWSGRPDSNRRRSAWKADALPTELLPRVRSRPHAAVMLEVSLTVQWRVMDSNHRRHSRQIYSLLPLATRATLRNVQFCQVGARYPRAVTCKGDRVLRSGSTRFRQSWRGDLNPEPPVYKTGALPLSYASPSQTARHFCGA